MRWIPHNELRASNTISDLAFNSTGLLACTSWDGQLHISSTYPSSSEITSISARFTRPLIALAWNTPENIWFGGGENRVCVADVNYFSGSGTSYDKYAADGPILGLSSSSFSSLIVCITPHTLVMLDPRSSGSRRIDCGARGVAVDVLGDSVCLAVANKSMVYDMRNMSRAVHTRNLITNANPLKVLWLDPSTYAISDTQSHVSVTSLISSSKSFVFKSNRFGINLQPRPIYSMAKNPKEPSILATGGSDKYVYIWDYSKRKLRTKIAFPIACTALAYNSDGHMAAGLSSDEWSTTTAKYSELSKARVMVTTE